MKEINTAEINICIPKKILADIGISEKKAAIRMLQLFVLDLYKNGKISGGKAAELLNINKYDFVLMIADEGIYYLDYTSLELEKEYKVIEQFVKKNSGTDGQAWQHHTPKEDR